MNATVLVKDLAKRIGGKQVLKGVDFQLQAGRVVGLIGPNGSGKTTLIKTLMSIYHPDNGEILICDEPAGFGTRRHISYMPDMNHLFQWMRVHDGINYYREMFGDFNILRCQELCTSLGINENEKIQDLSKGMKERVLIMLTFSRNSRLYLLDEPIGGIDPVAKERIIKTIFAGSNGESTILIATHQVKDVETLLDEVLFINDGRIIFAESADTIRGTRGTSIEECYLEVFKNA